MVACNISPIASKKIIFSYNYTCISSSDVRTKITENTITWYPSDKLDIKPTFIKDKRPWYRKLEGRY